MQEPMVTTRGGVRGSRSCAPRFRPGVILMEVMLALSLIVVVGMVVLSAVSQSTDVLRGARERQVAVDLARSAMAKLEAGIESTTTLSGPVPEWTEDANLAEVDEDSTGVTGWELAIETEPSGFEGLTYVSVTARKVSPNGVPEAGSAFTLRQLVRLAQKDEDGIGEKDDVMIEAERGAERAPRRSRDEEQGGDE